MGLLLINIDCWGAGRGGRTSVTVFAVAFISHRGDSAIAIQKLYVMQIVHYVFVLVVHISRGCATSSRW